MSKVQLDHQSSFLQIQILPTDPIVKIHQHSLTLLSQINRGCTDTTPYQNKTFCIYAYNKLEFLFSLDIAHDDKRTFAELFKKTPKIREIILKNPNLHFAVMGSKEPKAPLTIRIGDTLGYSREIKRVMPPISHRMSRRCALMWAKEDRDSGFTATRLSLLFQGKQDLGIEFSTRENFIKMVERLYLENSTNPELKSLIQKIFECALINTDDLEAWKLAFSTSTVDPLEEPHFKLISYVHSINFDLYEIDPSGEESFYYTMKCSFSESPVATVSLTYLRATWMPFSDALVIDPTTADIDLIEIINQDYIDSSKQAALLIADREKTAPAAEPAAAASAPSLGADDPLSDSRRITQVGADRCSVMWAYPDGNCGFTATYLSLILQGQQALGEAFSTREKFIALVERLHQNQDNSALQSLISEIFQEAGSPDLANWKKQFKGTGYYMADVHFKLISYVYGIEFKFYALSHDTGTLGSFIPEIGSERIYENTTRAPIATVHLTHVSTQTNAYLNHFDALVINPTEDQIHRIQKINSAHTNPSKQSRQLVQRTTATTPMLQCLSSLAAAGGGPSSEASPS